MDQSLNVFSSFCELPDVFLGRFLELLDTKCLYRMLNLNRSMARKVSREMKKRRAVGVVDVVKLNFGEENGDEIVHFSVETSSDQKFFDVQLSNDDGPGIRKLLTDLEKVFPCKKLELIGSNLEDRKLFCVLEDIFGYFENFLHLVDELTIKNLTIPAEILFILARNNPKLSNLDLENVSISMKLDFIKDLTCNFISLKSIILIDCDKINFEDDSIEKLAAYSKSSKLEQVTIKPYHGQPKYNDFDLLLDRVTKCVEIFWENAGETEDLTDFEEVQQIYPFYRAILKKI